MAADMDYEDTANAEQNLTPFLSEDIRYKKGGIYEHGEKYTPPKKLLVTPKAAPKLAFIPRAVKLKQPKPEKPADPPPKPKRKKKKKADATYALKGLPGLDTLLDELPSLPPLPPDAPFLLPREDIRNAQDLDDVALLWSGETVAQGNDVSSVWSGEWRQGFIYPEMEGQTLSVHSHRTLAADEYPVLPMYEMDRDASLIMSPKIRLPVSMDINAYLNSCGQGRILLGIADDRQIKGLFLTVDQRHHVLRNLDDLLRLRYNPPVSRDYYSINFIPVIDQTTTITTTTTTTTTTEYHAANIESSRSCETRRRHLFRTSALCWCDRDALAQIKFGNPPPRYVIEIDINRDEELSGRLYVDEVGCVCVRKGSENVIPSVDEILADAVEKLDRLRL